MVRDRPVLDVGGADTVLAMGTSAPSTSVHPGVRHYRGVRRDLDGDGIFEDSAAGSPGQTLSAAGPKTYAATGEFQARFFARDGEGN